MKRKRQERFLVEVEVPEGTSTTSMCYSIEEVLRRYYSNVKAKSFQRFMASQAGLKLRNQNHAKS